MNLVRLGLKWRLYSGFGVLVLLGIVLAFFTIWELSSIKNDTQNLSDVNDNSIRAFEVAQRIEKIRGANLRYTIDADEQAIKDAATAESSATEVLKDAAVATLSEERRKIYNGLRSDIDSMRAKRETLVGLGTQMMAERAMLFTGGDELTAATDRLVESRAAVTDSNVVTLLNSIETSILLVRVANWRFLATRDRDGLGTFKANAERAIATVAALEKAELPNNIRGLVGPVKASLAVYISNFDALSASLLKSDKFYWQSMEPQSIDMQAKIDKAQASLKQASDSTKMAAFAAIGEITLTSKFVAGLVLVLGALIAWLVSRSILRPVAGMTAAMGRLAAGDYAVEIPSRDSADEIGAMAKAVEVFRQTAIDRKKADRRIGFLAHHDVLTGLANRASLIDRMNAALVALAAKRGHLAVHFIDLDHFKEINDRFGHDGGDFLLKTIAERLRAVIRSDDIVARLGGDEFVLVQPNISGREQAEEFAQRLGSGLAEPVRLKGNEYFTTVSIGVALAPADGDTPERLLKSADLAVYNSKAEGRNCVRFFLPEMDAELQGRIELEEIIRNAVLHGRFELHYQPIFQMSDRRLIGFEALIRLPKEDGSLIPPLVFIPVAEDMRLIDKIGLWVLREACRTAASWPEHLTVAVNLSPAQFLAGSVSEIVAAALEEANLKPFRLELEITETLLLGDSESVMTELRALKELGVAIVMDDFGTGYSSLSYLWRFPFDKIKIDRSFMQGFDCSDRDAETVVKTIITLGRELHMHVTIEGVETAKQAAFLDSANGEQAQGFYFGRPVREPELAACILADFQKGLTKPTLKIAPDTSPHPVKSIG